jgi:hypothetical protein
MESYFLMRWRLFYIYHGELLFDEMTTFLPLSWRVTFWWDDNFSTFIMELHFDEMTTFLPWSWSYFLMRWRLFYLYHNSDNTAPSIGNNELNIVIQLVDLHFLFVVNITGNWKDRLGHTRQIIIADWLSLSESRWRVFITRRVQALGQTCGYNENIWHLNAPLTFVYKHFLSSSFF